MPNDHKNTPSEWLKIYQNLDVAAERATDPDQSVRRNCVLLNSIAGTHSFDAEPGGFIKLLQDLSLKQIKKPDVDDA